MTRTPIVALLIFLTGCATQSKILTSQALQEPLNRYSALAIDVVPGSGVARNADFEKVRENLINAIATKLPGRTSLTTSSGASGKDALKMKVLIKRLSYTSQAARVLVGLMAGSSELLTDIELTDQRTGQVLWRASTEARSGKQFGVFSPSSTTQVEALSEQIVAELEKHQ